MKEHNGCLGCKYENELPSSQYCQGCKQNAIDKWTAVESNFDRIKRMNEKELTKLICGIIDIGKDKFISGEIILNYDEHSILAWLLSDSDTV